MNKLTIFNSGGYSGVRTAWDASALPGGILANAVNVRYDNGTLRLREGITELALHGLSPAGSFVGGKVIKKGSNLFYLVALDFSGTTRIYYGVYNGSTWSGLTEVTTSGGQYGNTRRTTPTSGFVTFTPVYSSVYGLNVIAQTGEDEPLVIPIEPTNNARKIEAIPAPTQAQSQPANYGVLDYLDLGGTPSTAFDDVGFTLTVAGTPQYYTISLGIAGGVVVGDTASIDSANDFDLSASEQLLFVSTSESADNAFNLFNFIKLEVKNTSGTYYTVHDPVNGLDNMTVVDAQPPGYKIIAFPVADLVKAGASLSAVDGFRITLQNLPPTGTGWTLAIRGILASGVVTGGSQYAVAWRNTNTRTNSPGVVLPISLDGVGVSGIFPTSYEPNISEQFRLPISENLYYSIKVPTYAPSTTDRDKGVDYMEVYRKDPGDEYFYYVGEKQTSAYSGSWAYQSPFSASVNKANFVDNVPTWSKIQNRIAPSAYVEPIPVGQASLSIDGKLFVGTYKSNSSDPKSVIKVSDTNEPFRFRSLPLGDALDDPGFMASLEGNESVVGMLAASSSIIGASGVYAFTTRNIYRVGATVRKIAETGTYSGGSVCQDGGRAFFLDAEGALRRMGSSVPNISRYKIDLRSLDQDKVSAVIYRDRLYVLGNDGADKVYVWSDDLGEFESIDTPGVAIKQFEKFDYEGSPRLLCWDSEGNLYQYESGTTDDGAQIPITITTPEYHNPNWEQMTVKGSQIVCTDKNSESMTVSYTGRAPNGSASGTINLDVASGSAWKVDKNASGNDPAVTGCSIQITYSATLEGPFSIYSLTTRTHSRAGYGATS